MVRETRFTLRLVKELDALLSEKAERLGYTKNALIVQVLWDYVEKQDEKEKSA